MNHTNNYIFTGNKVFCSGCGACVQVCNHKALRMSVDSEGFLYPLLDKDKCVECGLCNKICPVTGNKTENKYGNQQCFVATTNNSKYYLESASIGICTMLSEHIISEGGIVYGVFLDESQWTAYHVAIDSIELLYKIRNSKYLQSDTKSSFSEVKQFLKEGRIVLFIGTPCQIAGLKSFLKKDYDTLYTIDIICHGVFSPLLMPLEVDYWEKKFGGKIRNFRFRSKRVYKHINGGMVNFDSEHAGKTTHYERHASSSPTYRCFAYSGDGMNYNMRPSCYNCHFRSLTRYGDITVGDPWYIPNAIIKETRLKSSNAIRSLYSVNTPKGKEFIASIKRNLFEEELSVVDSFCQPATLETCRIMPEVRSELFQRCQKEDYGILVERLLKCNLDDAQKIFERKYRKIKIKKLLKRFLLIK